MNSILEITLTGLCVLSIQGAANDPHPADIKGLVIYAPQRTHVDPDLIAHAPRISFRARDYQLGPLGVEPISIGPDGDEVVSLDIPLGDAVKIQWDEDKGLETIFTLDWQGDDSVGLAPSLRRFGIDSIEEAGESVGATISFPFGRLESRRVITDSGNVVLWNFGDGQPAQPVANHLALVSTAEKGATLLVVLGGKPHALQAPEGEKLEISISNLPETALLKRQQFEAATDLGHLKWLGTISPTRTPTVRLPSVEADHEMTLQGGFCPTTRFHWPPLP